MMMNKATSLFCADRMQFIVAAMTKDYENASSIAKTILRAEPGNTTLQHYLTILEKEGNKRKKIQDDSDVSESDSEPSVDSNSEDTESNSDNSTDSDNNDETIAENKSKQDLIKTKKCCHKFRTVEKLIFDCGKEKPSHKVSDKRNYVKKIDKIKFGNIDDLQGKMIRVLPIRLSRRINAMK